jgi:hypothetical protein
MLITDEYHGYSKMCTTIEHKTVNHSYEYARKEGEFSVHSNTIEGFWALLKRGIVGQFHKVSKESVILCCIFMNILNMWDTLKKTAEWINLVKRIEDLERRVRALEEQVVQSQSQGKRCPKCRQNTVFLNPQEHGIQDPFTLMENPGQDPRRRYWICENQDCIHQIEQIYQIETSTWADIWSDSK